MSKIFLASKNLRMFPLVGERGTGGYIGTMSPFSWKWGSSRREN